MRSSRVWSTPCVLFQTLCLSKWILWILNDIFMFTEWQNNRLQIPAGQQFLTYCSQRPGFSKIFLLLNSLSSCETFCHCCMAVCAQIWYSKRILSMDTGTYKIKKLVRLKETQTNTLGDRKIFFLLLFDTPFLLSEKKRFFRMLPFWRRAICQSLQVWRCSSEGFLNARHFSDSLRPIILCKEAPVMLNCSKNLHCSAQFCRKKRKSAAVSFFL